MKKEEGVRTSLPWAKQASKKIAWRACGAIVDGAQRRTGPNLGGKAALARKGICKICFKGRTTLLRSLHSDRNNGSTPPTHKKEKSWRCARRHISTVSRHGVGNFLPSGSTLGYPLAASLAPGGSSLALFGLQQSAPKQKCSGLFRRAEFFGLNRRRSHWMHLLFLRGKPANWDHGPGSLVYLPKTKVRARKWPSGIEKIRLVFSKT